MSEFVVTENRVCCGPKSVELFRFAFCVCSFCTLLVRVWSSPLFVTKLCACLVYTVLLKNHCIRFLLKNISSKCKGM